MNPLNEEFGSRLVTLHDGQTGLRGGLCFEAKAVAGDEPLMDFIGSDGTVDRYREVIDQKGWQLDNFKRNPVIPDCHDYSSITKILGRAESVSVKNGRLVNRVRFATDNPLGSLAWKLSLGGFIKSQSVGFIPLEWTNGVGKDQPARTYTKCELLEISLVVVPANPGATLGLALKSGAINRKDVLALADYVKSVEMLNAELKVGDLVTPDPDYDQNDESPWNECKGQTGRVERIAKGFGVAWVKFPLVEEPVAFRIETLIFCSDQPDPAAKGSASGAGVHDAQLLNLARDLRGVLSRT